MMLEISLSFNNHQLPHYIIVTLNFGFDKRNQIMANIARFHEKVAVKKL
jgi:hypothetical protein